MNTSLIKKCCLWQTFHSMYIWAPLFLFWADLQCVVLSPLDACIDQFNTTQSTWEPCLCGHISSPARPLPDKYQREQRTCLSYPFWHQWSQHAPAPPNCFFFCGNLCPWQQRAQAEGGFVWIGMIMAIGSPKHRLHPRWMTSPLIVPCSHEWKLPQLKRYCHSHDKKKRGVCRDLTLRLGTVLFSWDCLFLSLWLLLCSRLHIELLQECR